jgi:hypothetical protein
VHPSKQSLPTNSTDAGRKSDFNEEQISNALSPIRTISESTGNGELASLGQHLKQQAPIVLTVDGRMTDSREEHLRKVSSAMSVNVEPEQNETD